MIKHLNSRGTAVALLVLALAAAPLAGQSGPMADGEAIRPGDLVRVQVLRAPELSGDFQVNQFGTVVLPLIGEYDVTRVTQRMLRDEVIKALTAIRFAPDIEVVVLRRIRVVGEVNAPGVYTLDPTMSVADAIAMARGRTEFAEEGRVVLRRGAEVIDADLLLESRVSNSPIRSGDEILIPRRSWMNLNAPAVITGVSAFLGLMVTLIAR